MQANTLISNHPWRTANGLDDPTTKGDNPESALVCQRRPESYPYMYIACLTVTTAISSSQRDSYLNDTTLDVNC